MMMGSSSVPIAPDMFKVRVPVVAEPVTISVPVPVRVPVAVRESDDAVIACVPRLMFPSFASVPETRRPMSAEGRLIGEVMVMSPAVWLREKISSKPVGMAVCAPAVAVAR